MKTKIFGFFAILLSLFIVACDVIPENDRITETDKITPMKKVLLLDFTDQACPNCPQAAVVVEQLKEDYAADFIPVTIHASPRNLPLVTSDGNAYDVHFGTNKTGHPAAVVDGRFEGTFAIPAFFKCRTIVEEQFNFHPSVDIDLAAEYQAESRELNIELTLTAQKALDNPKVLIWIIEDNIIDKQSVEGEIVPVSDYLHHHIFRASVNGTWGDELTMLPVNVSLTIPYHYNLDEKWKPEDISIVAFVYNANTDAVYGVNEAILYPVNNSN